MSGNLAARKHSNVVSGGFWESRGLYGRDEKAERKTKRKGNKDDRRNSNASLKQSESISMFVLLSAGSLNSEERASCVELVCV